MASDKNPEWRQGPKFPVILKFEISVFPSRFNNRPEEEKKRKKKRQKEK